MQHKATCCGFSTTGLSDNAKRFSLIDLEADIIYSFYCFSLFAGREVFFQIFLRLLKLHSFLIPPAPDLTSILQIQKLYPLLFAFRASKLTSRSKPTSLRHII